MADMKKEIIKVSHITKEYRLGAIGSTTLRDDLKRLKARVLHQEDPTAKLGSKRSNEKGMFKALDDISFSVYEGEALGIIGANGAGKSTLLKLITRVTGPSGGQITLHGRVASLLEVGTGFHSELTGRENVYVNGAILGMKKEEIDERMEEIIEFSECREFIDTPVKRYSSGMNVKLAFAVAAHLSAEILIMDEVLAVGDITFQTKCIKKMQELASSGKTILYVSHNMDTIRKLCSRCLVLSQGKLIFEGDTEEAISRYIGASFSPDTGKQLGAMDRPYRVNGGAHMEQITLIDKENATYIMGEKLCFELVWSAACRLEELKMRLVVFRCGDGAAAVSFSENMENSGPGRNVHRAELDISALLPGKYSLEICLVQIAENGCIVKQDALRSVLDFEVITIGKEPVFDLYNRDWGYFRLPDATVASGGK